MAQRFWCAEPIADCGGGLFQEPVEGPGFPKGEACGGSWSVRPECDSPEGHAGALLLFDAHNQGVFTAYDTVFSSVPADLCRTCALSSCGLAIDWLRLEPVEQVGAHQWPAEIVALRLLAAKRTKAIPLLGGLHALAEKFQAQFPTHGDNR